MKKYVQASLVQSLETLLNQIDMVTCDASALLKNADRATGAKQYMAAMARVWDICTEAEEAVTSLSEHDSEVDDLMVCFQLAKQAAQLESATHETPEQRKIVSDEIARLDRKAETATQSV